jgi:hypothetical protein
MAISLVRCKRTLGAALALGVLVLAGCSIRQEGGQGQDKKVEIKTPLGGVSINGDNAAQETELAVYPGARPKQSADSKNKSANLSLASGHLGFKLAVVEMTTDDAPEKVAAFYRKELAKYGKILECAGRKDVSLGWEGKSSDADKDAGQLTCGNDTGGKVLELKVGTRENMRLVAVEPKDGHTEFALVYVRVQRKDEAL